MRRKQMVYIMLCVVLLSGCGTKQEIPKLVNPVVNNESFRPVEYGSVSKMEIQIADVLPEEYCHFATRASALDEICVDLGQYVEEGDVLAIIDTSDIQMELSIKQTELDFRRKNYSYQEKIYKEQKQIEKYKRQDFETIKDEKSAKNCDTAMDVLDESKRYDKLLCEHQITILEEEIAKLQKDAENGVIRATHSGYVTYVKNLEETNLVHAYENVVIVSDYEQLHLELTEDISSRFYTHYIGDVYNQIYANVKGKQCDVKVYEYSNRELVAMQSADRFSRIRLEVDNLKEDASVGDKILVYFTNSNKEYVLRVGKDSLYSDGKEHFVYVKKEKGKEKRQIVIGYQGQAYVEVTDGLQEGEWVYYSSSSIIPEQYEMYAVERRDYTPTNGDITLKGSLSYTKKNPYIFDKDAMVKKVCFAEGDEVKKGDLLCVLDTRTGNAKLKEMKQNITNLTQDYKSNVKSLDKQIKDLMKEIDAEANKIDKIKEKQQSVNQKQEDTDGMVAEEDASVEEPSSEEEVPIKEANQEELSNDERITTIVQQLQCQKTILQYEKKKMEAQYEYDYELLQQEYEKMLEMNSGQGTLEIYAEQDGVLCNLNIYEDKEWKGEEGTILFQVCDVNSKKLLVNTKTDCVGIGNSISVRKKDGMNSHITGIVVGNAISSKTYIAMKEEKVYITYNDCLDGENKVYVSLQDVSMDEEIWRKEVVGNQVTYSLANLKEVVVIPDTMLHEELDPFLTDDKQYYVWKIVDDILVKQYVQVETAFGTSNQVCVLDGLEEGDILAKPIVNEE